MTTTKRLRIQDPGDIVALVPTVLGFHPTESLVMLTFARGAQAFHARIDLPEDPTANSEVIEVLIRAAVANAVDAVVVLAYSADADRAAEILSDSLRAMMAAALEVIDLISVQGEGWFEVVPDAPSGRGESGHCDVESHWFTAQNVLDGRVTHRSRADLAATLTPVAEDVERVALFFDDLEVPEAVEGLAAEGGWLAHTTQLQIAGVGQLTDATAARLIVGLGNARLRDLVCSLVTRSTAEAHVSLWSDVLRRCPEPGIADVASVLAFSSWLSGQGALAWCALDWVWPRQPWHPLGRRVAELLEHAVSPRLWEVPVASAQA